MRGMWGLLSRSLTTFWTWRATRHARARRCIRMRTRGRKHSYRCWALNARVSRQGCRSEEHTSELQSLMRISYAVFCLKKKTEHNNIKNIIIQVYNHIK